MRSRVNDSVDVVAVVDVMLLVAGFLLAEGLIRMTSLMAKRFLEITLPFGGGSSAITLIYSAKTHAQTLSRMLPFLTWLAAVIDVRLNNGLPAAAANMLALMLATSVHVGDIQYVHLAFVMSVMSVMSAPCSCCSQPSFTWPLSWFLSHSLNIYELELQI